ncbi:MAG: hypothetical protein CMJ28_07520 [Phycisphaerae bacterium]|nr:hypothetical protein [Phycisphaerae bacterium]
MISHLAGLGFLGLISGCGTQQESLVLDDYRLRLTSQSSDVMSDAVDSADEGQLVDCLVGHVAGRPLYAHDILDLMRDELEALAAKSDSKAFQQEARVRVRQRLEGEIVNRLLIEEAALQRDPDINARFNDQVQVVAEILSRNSGLTDSVFRRKVQEEQGITPVQLARNILVQDEVRQYQVGQAAAAGDVTWQDIERLYSRQLENFDEGSFTLARFELSESNDVPALQAALSSWRPGGDPSVLESFGKQFASPRSGGLWLSYEFEDGGIQEVTFGVPELQTAVRSLTEDRPVTPVIEVNGQPWIVVLRSVERSAPEDLWDPDVQDRLRSLLQIEQQRRALTATRRALIDNGDISPPPNVMLQRLLEVVSNRHLTPEPLGGD